jgi:Flp pilus assembly protein TadB
MNEHIRTSDAERDAVTARLREHYAEGRLTREELDERIGAALAAKTVGDLRRVLADLPEPSLVAPAPPPTLRAGPYPGPRWRGPRLLPLAALALIVAVALPGAGWVLLGVVKVILVFWLVAFVVGTLMAARFRRRMRGPWPPGRWRDHPWGGPGRYPGHRHQSWR